MSPHYCLGARVPNLTTPSLALTFSPETIPEQIPTVTDDYILISMEQQLRIKKVNIGILLTTFNFLLEYRHRIKISYEMREIIPTST